jgi:hypothetical protein
VAKLPLPGALVRLAEAASVSGPGGELPMMGTKPSGVSVLSFLPFPEAVRLGIMTASPFYR